MNEKVILPVCAACSALGSGSLTLLSPGSFWFWVVVLSTALFAAVLTLLSVSRPAAPAVVTVEVESALIAAVAWPAVAIGLLIYFLMQVYVLILGVAVSASGAPVAPDMMMGLFATIPAVACLFAALLGASLLTRLQRPILGALVASATLIAVVVVVQVATIAAGNVLHLQLLKGAAVSEVALSLVLSLGVVCLSLGVGLAIGLAARRLLRWLSKA